MRLQESQFREILSALRSDAIKNGELRRSPRVGIAARGHIFARSDPTRSLEVYIRDLSVSGIGITAREAIEPPGQFTLVLPRHQAEHLQVVYKVRYCVRPVEGLFEIGAEFVSMTPPLST